MACSECQGCTPLNTIETSLWREISCPKTRKSKLTLSRMFHRAVARSLREYRLLTRIRHYGGHRAEINKYRGTVPAIYTVLFACCVDVRTLDSDTQTPMKTTAVRSVDLHSMTCPLAGACRSRKSRNRISTPPILLRPAASALSAQPIPSLPARDDVHGGYPTAYRKATVAWVPKVHQVCTQE